MEKLFELFKGNSSSYIKSTVNGELDERGKRITSYTTVHEPVTLSEWQQHLDGKIRIGFKPEEDGMCMWGCIDVDPSSYTNYSQKKYVDIIKNFKLPLVAIKSKSGGLHIFVFFKQWADVQKTSEKLKKINDKYFMAQEIFPCNKALNMPYQNMNGTMEYAYDDNNNPILIEKFIEIAQQKKIDPEDFYKLRIKEYEPESMWNTYAPCVQKLIQEKWEGNNRNNYLFNILVLEGKKNPSLNVQQIQDIGIQRNSQIFNKPLGQNEVINLCKSVHKGNYDYQCPPKHPELQPICNKELCQQRRLGIGEAVPEIIDDFDEVTFVKGIKTMEYNFKFRGKDITVTPEDIKDQKSFKVRLAYEQIYWMELKPSRKGPNPFDLLMQRLVESAVEDKRHLYQDTVEEKKYGLLKDFFEAHIEQDKFDKLKDNYVVIDSKTNMCYFKKETLEKFLAKKNNGLFKSASQALKMLGCAHSDYLTGHTDVPKSDKRNIWSVEMPEFVSYRKAKPIMKDTTSEMDEAHHDKFRKPENKKST